jgi:2-polyprenyl-6-methoxyphenol hydroxylase-like FAD-dependent oxidoreductase
MRAMVVGGGIGGLTAAVALRRAGVEAVVFEKAGELREIGAGISLWANAMKALRKLGLYDTVLAVGKHLHPKGELRSPNGRVFYEMPSPAIEERFGGTTMVVHRADLQKTLCAALGKEAIRPGAEVTGFEQDKRGVVARFAAGGREERCELLIGADGLHSTIRGQLLGDGPPLYAGYIAWRGVAELGDEPFPGGGAFETWGRGERFGLVKLGRRRVYWYATQNVPEGEEKAGPGRKAVLLARFGGWHEPIPSGVEATEESDIHFDGVYYREPATRWGEGRVTLLGDAAHPMTPDLGQGACQAIEDAVVLARSLGERGDDAAAALRLYEDRRKERTASVVRQSRRLGRIGQLENPLLCRLRDTALRALPKRVQLSAQLRQMEPIVGYEA